VGACDVAEFHSLFPFGFISYVYAYINPSDLAIMVEAEFVGACGFNQDIKHRTLNPTRVCNGRYPKRKAA